MCSARNNRLSEAKAPLICFRIDDSCSLRSWSGRANIRASSGRWRVQPGRSDGSRPCSSEGPARGAFGAH